MTFDPAIPAPNNFLSDDQPRIQSNFSRTNQSFGSDHVDFVTPANSGSGEHKRVTLNLVEIDPGLIYPKGRIYQKNFGVSPAPGFNHEVYFASTREISSQIITLLPTIKCMARFVVSGAVNQQVLPDPNPPNDSLFINITTGATGSVTKVSNSYTVTFATPLNYSSYFVFITGEGGVPFDFTITAKSTSQFTFRVSTSPNILGFMVI